MSKKLKIRLSPDTERTAGEASIHIDDWMKIIEALEPAAQAGAMALKDRAALSLAISTRRLADFQENKKQDRLNAIKEAIVARPAADRVTRRGNPVSQPDGSNFTSANWRLTSLSNGWVEVERRSDGMAKRRLAADIPQGKLANAAEFDAACEKMFEEV